MTFFVSRRSARNHAASIFNPNCSAGFTRPTFFFLCRHPCTGRGPASFIFTATADSLLSVLFTPLDSRLRGNDVLCFSWFNNESCCFRFQPNCGAGFTRPTFFLSLPSSLRRQGSSVFRFTTFTPLDSRLRGNDVLCFSSFGKESCCFHFQPKCSAGFTRPTFFFLCRHPCAGRDPASFVLLPLRH